MAHTSSFVLLSLHPSVRLSLPSVRPLACRCRPLCLASPSNNSCFDRNSFGSIQLFRSDLVRMQLTGLIRGKGYNKDRRRMDDGVKSLLSLVAGLMMMRGIWQVLPVKQGTCHLLILSFIRSVILLWTKSICVAPFQDAYSIALSCESSKFLCESIQGRPIRFSLPSQNTQVSLESLHLWVN